jgi:DNA helicase-2/ATP-dependent DNA helicase PcrA
VNELTEEQLNVVAATGHLYVRACPGAGKTRTMVHLATKAAESGGIRSGVASLSFTNAAVDELDRRVRGAPPSSILLGPPHYAGTFDAFLIRYVLGPDGHRRAPGMRVQFRDEWGDPLMFKKTGGTTMPVPLDVFVPLNGDLAMAPNRGNYRLRAFLNSMGDSDRERLLEKANKEISRRMKLGIMTAPFVRSEACRRLRDANAWRHLPARFHTVLVDEAQDCDPTDLRIIGALRSAGCRCVIIADPEQAIFRWRDADPRRLASLNFPERRLTGNFRSSAAICRATATLRGVEEDADEAVGPTSGVAHAVLVVAYEDQDLDQGQVGACFAGLLAKVGIAAERAVVLAHREVLARRTVGIT